MKYERFEQLPVWQAGMELAERAFGLTRHRAWADKGDLRSQLLRAALSVSNNVAEGFERGTTQELLSFLYIARGSAGEVRSMLLLAERLDDFRDLKSEISNLRSLAESISRQLRGWADSLQNSGITGQRYLTDAVRRQQEIKKTHNAFWKQVDQVYRQSQAQRAAAEGPTAPAKPPSSGAQGPGGAAPAKAPSSGAQGSGGAAPAKASSSFGQAGGRIALD